MNHTKCGALKTIGVCSQHDRLVQRLVELGRRQADEVAVALLEGAQDEVASLDRVAAAARRRSDWVGTTSRPMESGSAHLNRSYVSGAWGMPARSAAWAGVSSFRSLMPK